MIVGDDYSPFINMIDINSNEQLPRPRPRPEQGRTNNTHLMRVAEQQPTSWLTSCSGSSNSFEHNIGHHHLNLEEMKEKEERIHQERRVRFTLTDIDISSSRTITTSIRDIYCDNDKKKTSTKNKHHHVTTLFSLLLLHVGAHIKD